MKTNLRQLSLSELNRPGLEEYSNSQKIPLVIICDNLRSANNIGSVFRSADAFSVEKIILCGYSPIPPNKDIQKTALGATESVLWEYSENARNAILQLKNEDFQIIALEQTNEPTFLNAFIPEKTGKYALILGNEVKGVSEDVLEMCDFALEIPQSGTKHSLNVSVAAGIAIWKFFEILKNQ